MTEHRKIKFKDEVYIMTFEEVRSYCDTEEEAKEIWNESEKHSPTL